MRNLLCFFLFGLVVHGSKLPDDIPLCSKSDPKFEECWAKSITKAMRSLREGYKPLGFPKFEPLFFPEINMENSNGLIQNHKNVELTGLSNSTIKNITMNPDTLVTIIYADNPCTISKGDYALRGQLLIFPLNSKGKFEVITDNAKIKHTAKLARYEKNGKTHLRVKEWETVITPGMAHFNYENLIPGNKQLSDTVLQTMNENALQLYNDNKIAFEEAIAEAHKLRANIVCARIPEDELFLP